jgi:hypothetical protein
VVITNPYEAHVTKKAFRKPCVHQIREQLSILARFECHVCESSSQGLSEFVRPFKFVVGYRFFSLWTTRTTSNLHGIKNQKSLTSDFTLIIFWIMYS